MTKKGHQLSVPVLALIPALCALPLLPCESVRAISDSHAHTVVAGGGECMCRTTDECSTACTKVEQGKDKSPVYKYCNGTSTTDWCKQINDAMYWCEPNSQYECGSYVTCLLPACAGQCGEPDGKCYFKTAGGDPDDCP